MLPASFLPVTDSTASGPAKPVVRFRDATELKDEGPEAYLRALLGFGVQSMARNARAEVRVMAVGPVTIPLLIVEPSVENCDLCSQMAHHVHYARDEVVARTPSGLKWLVRLAYATFGGLLRAGRIDRVVYLGNWLYSTNPPLGLSAAGLHAARNAVRSEYPDHALVVRSVQPAFLPDLPILFRSCGFSLLKARDVFVWPRGDDSYQDRKNYRIDLRLLEQSDLIVAQAERLEASEAARLRELYCRLYIGKHNPLNAMLTEHFFLSTFKSGALRYRYLMAGDEIVGFYCFQVFGRILLVVALGYDLDAGRSSGVYRQLVMSCIQLAKEHDLHLSFSAGVDEFKSSRGGLSTTEYEAAYFRHLPLWRRQAWRLLQFKCWLSERLRPRLTRYQTMPAPR